MLVAGPGTQSDDDAHSTTTVCCWHHADSHSLRQMLPTLLSRLPHQAVATRSIQCLLCCTYPRMGCAGRYVRLTQHARSGQHKRCNAHNRRDPHMICMCKHAQVKEHAAAMHTSAVQVQPAVEQQALYSLALLSVSLTPSTAQLQDQALMLSHCQTNKPQTCSQLSPSFVSCS